MVRVGGNVAASLIRTPKARDARGVAVPGMPETVMGATGWLDYQSGLPGHLAWQAKVADTSHVFLTDYDATLAALPLAGLTLSAGGRSYEVLLIDDPMGVHAHLEVYLKAL